MYVRCFISCFQGSHYLGTCLSETHAGKHVYDITDRAREVALIGWMPLVPSSVFFGFSSKETRLRIIPELGDGREYLPSPGVLRDHDGAIYQSFFSPKNASPNVSKLA